MTKLSELLGFWRAIMWETLEMLWPSHACGSAVSTVPEPVVEFERQFGAKAHNTNSSSKMFLRKRATISQLFGGLMIVFPPAFPWKTHEKQSCLFGPQRTHEFWLMSNFHVSSLRLDKKNTRTSSEHVKSARTVVAQKSCRWTPRLGIGLSSPSLRKYSVNGACA